VEIGGKPKIVAAGAWTTALRTGAYLVEHVVSGWCVSGCQDCDLWLRLGPPAGEVRRHEVADSY